MKNTYTVEVRKQSGSNNPYRHRKKNAKTNFKGFKKERVMLFYSMNGPMISCWRLSEDVAVKDRLDRL